MASLLGGDLESLLEVLGGGVSGDILEQGEGQEAFPTILQKLPFTH